MVFTEGKYANSDADDLLNDLSTFPHAFLIACVCDRQVDAGIAWLVPHRLRHRLDGAFDLETLAGLTTDRIQSLFEEEPKIHRLWKRMPGLVHAAIRRVAGVYGGDAARIWAGNPDSALLVYRLLEFDGVGQKISAMAANILVRDFHVPVRDRQSLDIPVDTHIKRLFRLLGLVSASGSESQVELRIIFKARALHPEYPGILDLPLWELGRSTCRAGAPNRGVCPLRDWCAHAQEGDR
ncbi:MAG: iron-sulfur cluster loop [Deltaproteobacteria bacterium]|nr:iron-sulfur cluster loop [Deltaproteobacteria bacterium]